MPRPNALAEAAGAAWLSAVPAPAGRLVGALVIAILAIGATVVRRHRIARR